MTTNFYKNKTIWITGASSGIGRALAQQMSRHGAYLILSARSREELELTKQSLDDPESAEIVLLDMAQEEMIESVTHKMLEKHGYIDILINNAGISQRSLTLDSDMTVYHKLMEINYFGVIRHTKALLPSMVKRGGGHIITVTSVNGKLGSYMKSGYAASKHALHGFMDSMRAELSDQGIKVTLITPGYVTTNISKSALTADGSALNKMSKNTGSGMDVNIFAQRAVKLIAAGKDEIAITGNIERLALILKRYWPAQLRRMAAKRKEA